MGTAHIMHTYSVHESHYNSRQCCSCVAEYRGLAIDVARQKLYYTDAAAGDVGELSTNGAGHRVLINDSSSSPLSVVIDVDNR